MSGRAMKPVPNRPRADTWAVPFPRHAVLIGEADFIREAESSFTSQVRDMSLRTIPTDTDGSSSLPPGFPIPGPWCLIVDLVTSSRSLKIARKILLNTSNVPFIALASDPADLPDAE